MSEHRLPDDLSQWPSDPFALLGVSHGVGAADLRRAYTRLVKLYKPDHHPEEFRRIRSAYDAIQGFIEHLGWGAMQGDGDSNSDAKTASDVPSDSSTPVAKSPAPAPLSLDEELAAAWRLACEGDPHAAYRRLTELHERAAGHVDPCLRMYWLLKLWPEADAQRTRIDWLLAGLRRDDGSAGPLGMLYVRELSHFPELALDDRCRDILRQRPPSAWAVELAEARWQAAADSRRWSLIDEDLDALRPRWQPAADPNWPRLLLAAAQEWARCSGGLAQARVRALQYEIEHCPELGVHLQDDLVWLDSLVEFSEQWHGAEDDRIVPPKLAQVLSGGWRRDPAEYGPELLAYLRQLVLGGDEELDALDFLCAHRPALVAHWGRLLMAYAAFRGVDSTDGPWTTTAATAAIHAMLARQNWWILDYPAARLVVYAFCRREFLAPERVLSVLADRDPIVLRSRYDLGSSLAQDWSLRYACLAHRLLHA